MIMSRQQRLANAVNPITAPTTVPAPVNGWNTRDELDAMDPNDAVVLDNWFPDKGGVFVRGGYQPFASIVDAPTVKTLVEYDSGAVRKFLAAAGGAVYDITFGGIVSSTLGAGFTTDAWQTCNFLSTTFFCNGLDNAQAFDGTTLADAAFTGVALDTLIGVWQYQNRLFFWQPNSTGFWYAQLNSISGALAFFDLSAFSPQGGNLVAVTSVTHDGGNGVLDFIAFILSTGTTLLYYGNDPAQLTQWQLIGRYQLAPPVNIRAICTYGGDSFVTTFDDHMMLQQQLVALKVGTLPPRSKISGAVQAAVKANKNAFGWQSLYYPRGRQLIFNIPNADGTFDQHVCNTSLPTQPWCRFVGMNAYCWGIFRDRLYFSDASGVIWLADEGDTDPSGSVSAMAQQAWTKFGSPQRKRVTAVRPIVQSAASSYNFSLGFDYGPLNISVPGSLPVGPPITDDAGVAITDDAGTPIEGNGPLVSKSWRVGGGTGTAVSFALSTLSQDATAWYRTDLRLEPGNAL